MSKEFSFFAPCIFLDADFEEWTVDVESARLHKRKWQVSTFDLATLASNHRLHVPYQLMDVFLNGAANLEIEITDCDSLEAARDRILIFRSMLYANGISPFIVPFIATHSFNEYAGINARDSKGLIKSLPEGLREGITSSSTTVEVWPFELSLMTHRLRDARSLTAEDCGRAAWQSHKFSALENHHAELKAVRFTLSTAPQISHLPSSLLHLWTGIESLFPNVTAEVSFRLSLLIAELASPVQEATQTYSTAKRSYGHRSNTAHGNMKRIGNEQWEEAWSLVCLSIRAILQRGSLPTDHELIMETLTR